MVTYLKDAVEITPPLVELIRLVRNQNSLTQTSKILKLHLTKLCGILREDENLKTVREHVFTKAIQYIARENTFTLEELCDRLGIKENIETKEEFERVFIPVRISDRSRIVKEANDYIRKKEISQAGFIRELKSYGDSYFKKISKGKIKKFLRGDNQGVDIKLLKAFNGFLTEKETLTKIRPLGNIDSLYHTLNPAGSIKQIAYHVDLTETPPEEYGKKLTAQIEQAIIDYHQRNGKQELAPLVLLNLFGQNKKLCRLLSDFKDSFPALASYLRKTYDAGLVSIFDQALSSMPQQDVIQIADKYTLPVSDGKNIILPRIGVLAQELGSRTTAIENYSERRLLEGIDPNDIIPETSQEPEEEIVDSQDTLFKLREGIKIRRFNLEYEIMKKLDPTYWPSHKRDL